jgi:polysaccharide biosynthesis transport protein
VQTEASPLELIQALAGTIGRRWWQALLVFVAVSLGTIAVVQRLPSKYTSVATLVITDQKVSSDYVKSGNRLTPEDAIIQLKREILSDEQLKRLIGELNLYPKVRAEAQPEALLALIREEIVIAPADQVRSDEFKSFQITYAGDTPEVAKAVVDKVTSLFIDENTKSRSERASISLDFLESRVESTRRRLDAQEARLRGARSRTARAGDERAVNAAATTDLRTQLVNAQASSRGVQQQRFTLESTIAGSLATLQGERDALSARFTAQHPQVVAKEQQIGELQGLLTAIRTGSVADLRAAKASSPAAAQYRSQGVALLTDAEDYQRDVQRLSAELAGTTVRDLTGTPVGEVEMEQRDYETLKSEYNDAVAKLEQAKATAGLEQRQETEHFRLIDPPSLPYEASSPKRMRLNAGGAGAGIVLGLVLIFLLEVRVGSIHNERDLTELAGVPLVLSIPLILTPKEEKKAAVRVMLSWAAATLTVTAVAAVEFYVYRNG